MQYRILKSDDRPDERMGDEYECDGKWIKTVRHGDRTVEDINSQQGIFAYKFRRPEKEKNERKY